MEDYIIKDLVFKKSFYDVPCNYYISKIKIHDILNIEIKILESEVDNCYNVSFNSLNNVKCFTMNDKPTDYHCEYAFNSYKEAYEYANKEMKSLLNNFISSILVDIDDYIEEIDEEE